METTTRVTRYSLSSYSEGRYSLCDQLAANPAAMHALQGIDDSNPKESSYTLRLVCRVIIVAGIFGQAPSLGFKPSS